jgi:hypothetical protein
VTVDATFTVPPVVGGRITNVTVQAAPPAGWSAAGPTIRARTLRAGRSLTGRWTVTAPASGSFGYVDLPIVATYRFPGDPARRPVHVEQAVRVFLPPPDPADGAALSDLPFLTESNGWGSVERDRSNGEISAGDGRPISIGGTTFAKGIGMHAAGDLTVWLGGACTALTAQVGIDDEVTGAGSVEFQVLGDDGALLASSGVVRRGDGARPFTADVTGVRILMLRVTDGGDGKNSDHADWADPRLSCG